MGGGEMMDISEKYIEMCGKAEEIQSDWIPEVGTYFNSSMGGVCMYTGRLGTSGWTFEIICENDIEGRQVWLPRQDQLQDILSPIKRLELLNNFYDFASRKCIEGGLYSFEQLWLAFVMKETYGKIWNDEKKEWVRK